MRVVSPFDSIDITKGKEYTVVKEWQFGVVEIKDDKGEQIHVNTKSSAWTFGAKWKVIK
jgi:hypothetical protein